MMRRSVRRARFLTARATRPQFRLQGLCAPYFSVFDALTAAANFRNSLGTASVVAATANFYVNLDDDFTAPAFQSDDADPNKSAGIIPLAYAYSWDTIWHEYAHWVRNADHIPSPGATTEGVDHTFVENLTVNKPATGLNLAFSEGFADYFAVAVQATLAGTPQAAVPYVTGTLFTISSLVGRVVTPDEQIDLASQAGSVSDGNGGLVAPTPANYFKSNGQDQEVAVARLLYSLSTATFPANTDRGLNNFPGCL